MKTLKHLPIEPYKQRYTELLHTWESSTFSKYFEYEAVTPKNANVVMDVSNGHVLDRKQRPLWCLDQVRQLIERDTKPDVTYFSDFYTSGIDALTYSGDKSKKGAYCWAQSFDNYDFTATDDSLSGMMRMYEFMALTAVYDAVFVACPVLADLIQSAIGKANAKKIHVVGLPFSSTHVRSLVVNSDHTFNPIDVVYSSRWDVEKNPCFFLDVVEAMPDRKFAICTGWSTLRGTDTVAIARANNLIAKGRIQLYAGLDKPMYYSILEASSIQINTAKQDWVSFTLLEALSLNCLPLYPMFRSFPHTLQYDGRFLYNPNSVDDAVEHANFLLDTSQDRRVLNDILAYHNSSLDRIAHTLLHSQF